MVTAYTVLTLWALTAGAIMLTAQIALTFDADDPCWWKAARLVAPLWPVAVVVWTYRRVRR